MKKKLSGILAISLSLAVISTVGVFAETSTIPDWVKNSAKWWSEGQIAESDYISSLQYLINQGIIKIPISEVIATKVSLSDSERAQSIVVHIEGEENIGSEDVGKTFYTFSEFRHLSTNVNTSLGIIDVDDYNLMFYLMGLPSKDKSSLYQFVVSDFINSSEFSERFNVKVDILAGDATIIQTWDYKKCSLIDYVTFLDSDKSTYKFGENEEAEIKEFLLWECKDFQFMAP